MSDYYLTVARAMLEAGEASGVFSSDEPLSVVEDLADTEKAFFLELIKKLDQRLEVNSDLNENEISSIFTFVFARSCECANAYFANEKWTPEFLGMLDGKIPFYADSRLLDSIKSCLLPTQCAEALFELDLPGEADPKLALLESLKWTWRLGIHFFISLRGKLE